MREQGGRVNGRRQKIGTSNGSKNRARANGASKGSKSRFQTAIFSIWDFALLEAQNPLAAKISTMTRALLQNPTFAKKSYSRVRSLGPKLDFRRGSENRWPRRAEFGPKTTFTPTERQ